MANTENSSSSSSGSTAILKFLVIASIFWILAPIVLSICASFIGAALSLKAGAGGEAAEYLARAILY